MRGRVTVRVRIMAAVLVTTLLGMLVTGMVSYLLARQETDERVQRSLQQDSDEVAALVTLIRQGEVTTPVRTPRDVLRLAIGRAVPQAGQAILGLVDGKVVLVPGAGDELQRTARRDQELIRAAASVPVTGAVYVHHLSTARHPSLAYVSIPVQVQGSPEVGFYVSVIDLAALREPINRTYLTYAGLCLATLLVVGVVGYLVAGRLLAPLTALRRTAQRISEADLTERIGPGQLAGRDEISELGRTVNAMLDRLSDSFDTQRRMLDDAGHELRTPITIVRGHLELVDPGDPADVTQTRAVVLSELDRMESLVSDLLLLAKARRPDFVSRRVTDVSALMQEVAAKVRPLGERDWRLRAPPGLEADLDAQRITQALLQLAANAVRFTDEGAVIELGAEQEGATMRVWVRDEGTGIPADQQATVFDRFRQLGDQPGAGAGLGLAIVDAIAKAHDGHVELVSSPGRGSTFELVLPCDAVERVDPVKSSPAQDA